MAYLRHVLNELTSVCTEDQGAKVEYCLLHRVLLCFPSSRVVGNWTWEHESSSAPCSKESSLTNSKRRPREPGLQKCEWQTVFYREWCWAVRDTYNSETWQHNLLQYLTCWSRAVQWTGSEVLAQRQWELRTQRGPLNLPDLLYPSPKLTTNILRFLLPNQYCLWLCLLGQFFCTHVGWGQMKLHVRVWLLVAWWSVVINQTWVWFPWPVPWEIFLLFKT